MVSDFETLVGGDWAGTLTYRDYTTDQVTTIRSTLRVTREGDGWRMAIGYNDEPHADSAAQIQLLESGQVIQHGETTEPVVVRRQDGQRVEVITEFAGRDDNRPATIRHKYEFSAHEASLRKLVRVEGSVDFLKRNEYRWTR